MDRFNLFKILFTLLYEHTVISALQASPVNMENIGLRDVRNLGVIGSVLNKIGFIMCARECEKLNQCKGFNYMRSELHCELLISIGNDKSDMIGWRFVKTSSILEDNTLSTQSRDKICGSNGKNIQLSNGEFVCLKTDYPIGCGDTALMPPGTPSGVYTIKPKNGEKTLPVFCEMAVDGSGWTLIQKRTDGRVSVDKDWDTYKNGFGNLTGEHWLGNDALYILTSAHPHTLKIEMTKTNGEVIEATYSQFAVADATNKYRLHLSGFSGTTNDAFIASNGMSFSTKDQDNDSHGSEHCSQNSGGGGWWFKDCGDSSLNENKGNSCDGCVRVFWHDTLLSVKSVITKIKRNE